MTWFSAGRFGGVLPFFSTVPNYTIHTAHADNCLCLQPHTAHADNCLCLQPHTVASWFLSQFLRCLYDLPSYNPTEPQLQSMKLPGWYFNWFVKQPLVWNGALWNQICGMQVTSVMLAVMSLLGYYINVAYSSYLIRSGQCRNALGCLPTEARKNQFSAQ
jgi:hypothetical protein